MEPPHPHANEAVHWLNVHILISARDVVAIVACMADWNTARRGNTERTLTAAAGPSPCDPYRQTLTMRPSLKARPLVS